MEYKIYSEEKNGKRHFICETNSYETARKLFETLYKSGSFTPKGGHIVLVY